MNHTKRSSAAIRTTVGELAAAYYDAALAELKDEAVAQRVAFQMVVDAMKRRR